MESGSTGARVGASALKRASRSLNAPKVYRAITRWCIYLLFLLVPVWFLPWNLDVLEVNKQTLLIILTSVAALAWLGGMITEKKFTFRKGWLNLLPFVFLVSVLVSTLLSLGGFISWVGEATQEYVSFLTTGALVVLFYITINATQEARMLRSIFFSFLVGSTVAIIIGLLSILGVQALPFDFAVAKSFNTVGTLNAFGIFAIISAIFGNGLWLVAGKGDEDVLRGGWKGLVSKIMITFISLATLVSLVALDYWVLWVTLIFGILVLFTFSLLRAQEFPETHRFIMPMALFVVSLLLLFLQTPLNAGLPAEVTPSLKASWNVATQSLGDTSALFGSGPGTFIYDYAKYHSQDVNSTMFWNVRFDRGSSHFLTMLATVGVLGVLLWVLFVAMLGLKALARLVKEKNHAEWKLSFALFAPWATSVLAVFLYSSNMTLTFLFFGFSALLAIEAMRKVKTATVSESPRLGLAFSFLFVLVSVLVVSVLFVTGQRYAGEIAFARAVKMDAAGGELTEIVTKLDKAATYNRYNDIYYRNLAQALLLRVSEELSTVNEEMTSDQANLIRALTAASINAAKRSTDLGPNNVLNWAVRGSIYREVIAFIGGADEFALESFNKAAELSPVNPEYQTELGKVHLVIAETARQLTTSPDEETANDAQTKVDESLAAAETAFNKAIELKADYAPAHYQLAVVFERQGKLDEAVTKMESVFLYNQMDVGVAFQLGLLYLRQGNNDNAQVMFEHVVNLVPTYSNARWFLASIYELNGEIDKAIEQVEEVLALNPDNQLVQQRLDQLKSGETSEEIPEPVEAGEQTATDVSEGQTVEEDPVVEDEATEETTE